MRCCDSVSTRKETSTIKNKRTSRITIAKEAEKRLTPGYEGAGINPDFLRVADAGELDPSCVSGAWKERVKKTSVFETLYALFDNRRVLPADVLEAILRRLTILCRRDAFRLRKVLDCCPFGSPTSYRISSILKGLEPALEL